MKKSHYLFILIGLMLTTLPMIHVPPSTSAQGTTTITLDPVEVGVGHATFVEGHIACGVAEGCGGFTVQLTFDYDVIRVYSAQVGPYLGEQVFSPLNTVDNGNGTITLAAAAMQPPPPGAEDLLFRLEIGGLAPGTAAIEFVEVAVQNVNGENIPASGSGTTVTVFETGIIPRFSPPADWDVVYVSDRDGNPEIYVIHADGTALRRLTVYEGVDGGPTWSPDGSQIAFHSDMNGALDIYVMDDVGGNLVRLTTDPALDYQPAWSPSGAQIAFVSEREGSADIFIMNADGTEQQRITTDPGTEQQPSWSPDGSQIAYVSNSGGTFEVFLINADGSGEAQSITALSGTDGWWPAWKPDGTLLSFTNEENDLADIVIMTPTGENPARLNESPNLVTSTDWSPDERYLVFVSALTGLPDVFVLDVANNYWFRLTEDPAIDSEPDWRALGPSAPCLVSTTRNNVAVRVGPGLYRSEFTRLWPGQEYSVIAQWVDENGDLWYELDKAQIPGHEAVNALWVFSGDVDAIGACGAVALGTPPPVVPIVPETPGETPGDDDDDGGWGPCGSCETCGHPAEECVTTPEGECVWDPQTCSEPPPDQPGDDDEPGCAFVSIIINPDASYGSVTLRPPANCGNGWSPGTSMLVVASATPNTTFVNWAGSTCPGVSGTNPSVNWTIVSSCTIVANFQ